MRNKELLVVGILALLIVIALVQAIQLVKIKSEIADIGSSNLRPVTSQVSGSSSGGSGSGSSDGSSIPTNLQNLPGMVGGC